MSEKNEWKLVPVVPTDEMMKAAFDQFEISAPGFATGNDARRAIYAAMLNAAPSAPGDAQDERQGFETWAKKKKMPLARIGQQYDDFWVDHAWNGWQARAALVAPAAGDALDALRELLACDNLKKQIASMQVCVLETEDDVQELDAMMSDLARRQPAAWDAARAALAAQVPHKGDAA